MKIGDLVYKIGEKSKLYRVSGRIAGDCVTIAPYVGGGREVTIMKYGHSWTDGSNSWKKATSG